LRAEGALMTGVFFGTSAFAVPSLQAFARAVDCKLVVTQPDKPSGRGHQLQPTPVKVAARELGLEMTEPEQLRDAIDSLRAIGADLFAVASYGKIIPQSILDLPRLGALNVHPSLLPLYRGATPLQAQLRDGVATGGVTIILMDAGMDTGDIVLQEKRPIAPDETYGDLHDQFAALGAELLAKASAELASGALQRTPQAGFADPEAIAATATRPLTKSDLEVDWRWTATRIVNFVRSLSPAPAARAEIDGVRVKILRAKTGARKWPGVPHMVSRPGTLIGAADDAAVVTAGEGLVAVERLVSPNRAPVDGNTFALPRLKTRENPW
jgi:methionyl-tRNA formyltransferase